MLCYLIYINNTKIHFTTSYVPNSKFKLHRTCKFCHTYKLQHTHYFFQAKTGLPHILVLLLLQWSCQTSFFFFFFFPKKMECGQFKLTDSVSECAKNRKLFKTWGHAHSISCACAQTPAKAFRSAINHTHTQIKHAIASVSSRYGSILMLLFKRRLLLIIKLKLC